MEDWGELALMYLEDVDPAMVSGMDLANVVDTLRTGGLTRVEANTVARWLFACLPASSSDGGRASWYLPAPPRDEVLQARVPPPTVH